MDLSETAPQEVLEAKKQGINGSQYYDPYGEDEMTLILIAMISADGQAASDADSDWFYLPPSLVLDSTSGNQQTPSPALIVLSCTGAGRADLDSMTFIADSLNLVLATCHASRNHRSTNLNDADIMKTTEKLLTRYPVDASRVYIYGFSGQAVQAMMALFIHPDVFQGVVSACGHAGAVSVAQWQALGDGGKSIYLISRTKDWNLEQNRYLHDLFRTNDIRDTLVVLKGKHSPPPVKAVFRACQWLLEDFEKTQNPPRL
jgi:predicted esterase